MIRVLAVMVATVASGALGAQEVTAPVATTPSALDLLRACTAPITTPAGLPCPQYGKYLVVDHTLYVEGWVDSELYDIMKREDPSNKIERIEFNSPGGDLSENFIYDVAALIRERGITTSLRSQAQCASACTVLYQAGVQRVAAPDSLFGYHSERNPSGETDYLTQCLGYGPHAKKGSQAVCAQLLQKWVTNCQVGTDILFGQIEKFGASPQLYADYKTQPQQDDWLDNSNPLKIVDWAVSAKTAQTYNVVTELLPYTPPGAPRPVASVPGAMAQETP